MRAGFPTIRSRLVALAAASIMAAGIASLWSSTPAEADVAWHLETEYPQSTVSGAGLSTFARLVAARTNGFVTATIAFDNTMHITSGELVHAAEEQRVTGGDAFASQMEATDPVFGLPSLPFVVQSVAAARAINAKARPDYEAALAKHGMRLLYITVWPATGLWSDRKLDTAGDLHALAVRTYDDNSALVMKAAGATAVFLPLNQAIGKIKTHELNAILTSGDGGAGRKLWDDLKYFAAINYAIPISIAFVRADAFAALPAPVQEQVLAAARETEQSQADLIETRTEQNYKRMRENGVAISDPPPAAIVSALKSGAAPTISAWEAKVPAGVARLVEAERGR